MSDYHDLVDVKKLEWILENSGKLNLGKSYVKGVKIGGDAQLEILRKYYKRAVMFNGSVPQSYYQHDNMGRRFTKDIGLTNLSRAIRHTISKNLIDIDMKNAHPCILLYLCKKYNLHTPFLERYVNNRDELLGELMVGRQLSRDGAKKMLLRAINRDDGKYQQEMNDPDWLYDYHQEMKQTLHNLSLHYPEHMLQAEKSKKRKNVELWNMCGSAVNRVLCDMEDKLLCIVEDIVKKNGFIVRVLAYDGCMIERQGNVLLNYLFSMIEEEVNRQYPTLLFKMDEKIMNEGYIVPDDWISEKEKELQLKIQKQKEKEEKKEQRELDKEERRKEKERKRINKEIEEELEKEDLEEAYKEWKVEFEKNHTKIMEPPSVIYVNSLDQFDTTDIGELCAKYSHCPNYSTFLKKWWVDPEIQVKIRADNIPPNIECDPTIFNLWKPYTYEGYTVNPSVSQLIDRNLLLNHILVLCGNDIEIYNYMLDWVAQFLQYPNIKTTMPVFTSIEGAGKDSFLCMLKKMIGKRRIVETTKPEDIFGRFNYILTTASLIVLNEMNASDLQKYDKDMKHLITEGEVVVEKKGSDLFEIKSFHRLVLFTNKTDHPVQTSKNDRRKLIIRCSDEKVGNDNYFTTLYKIMEDDNVMASLYQFFMKRNIHKFNIEKGRNFPKSEYQQTIMENYSNPVSDWIKDLTLYLDPESGREYKEAFTWTSAQCLNSFQSYSQNHGIKLELNVLQLLVRVKNLKINGIEKKKTKFNSVTTFDLKLIFNYFNK